MALAEDKVQSGLRIKKTVKADLEKIAKNEGRSYNNLLEYILTKYVEEHKSQSK